MRNLAKKHMRLTAVLLTIVCSLWKKNSENSVFCFVSELQSSMSSKSAS